ncbi:MAG: ankyrin repeat domain-containing protein [Campylobacterota bacterium]|nr:ankyrin repeat domain-containing protein [Campylobacterota bacterium]
MKKIIYASLVVLLALTGCSQKFETNNEVKSTKVQEASNNDFIAETALHDAIRAKDTKLVTELIEKGASVSAQDKYRYTPLHLAVRLNQYSIVENLIANGASVNNTDKFGDTPLLDSTRNSTSPMSKLLICNGADKNAEDRHAMTPLHNASKNNDLFIAMLLQNDNIAKMCEKLDITLTNYDQGSNKICGEIPTGMATKINLTVSDESNESMKPFGPYDAVIEDNKYCAQLDKPIKSDKSYIVTAVGTNSAEQDIEIANLNDLRAGNIVAAPQSEYIEGLYEALMSEFGPDFATWNAELDKNGLVFRFKNPADLFKHGSSKLSQNFKNILTNFYPRYLNVISQYKDQIAETRVEGHTSSVYRSAKNDAQRYAKNKKLSTARANKVFDYTMAIKDPKLGENLEWLMDNYKPYGMSYDDLVMDASGVEDQAASRRVEFRINKIMN